MLLGGSINNAPIKYSLEYIFWFYFRNKLHSVALEPEENQNCDRSYELKWRPLNSDYDS